GLLRRRGSRHGIHPAASRSGARRGILQRRRVRDRRRRLPPPSILGYPRDAERGAMSRRSKRMADVEKESAMGRVKEEPRGRLGALQDLLSGGSKLLIDQAQTLGVGVQKSLSVVGRGVESQLVALVGTLEAQLTERLDELLNRLSVSLRRDIDRVRDRVRAVENRLADVPREGIRELVAPVQAIAAGASERASAAIARIEELTARLQGLERRISELARDTARDTLDACDFRQRLERTEQRLTDLGREVGTKLGELGALRE